MDHELEVIRGIAADRFVSFPWVQRRERREGSNFFRRIAVITIARTVWFLERINLTCGGRGVFYWVDLSHSPISRDEKISGLYIYDDKDGMERSVFQQGQAREWDCSNSNFFGISYTHPHTANKFGMVMRRKFSQALYSQCQSASCHFRGCKAPLSRIVSGAPLYQVLKLPLPFLGSTMPPVLAKIFMIIADARSVCGS